MNEKHIEVLEHYELEINSVRKGRGAWICETEHGVKLLREYKGTVKRLEFEDQVLKLVQEYGYPWVDSYIRNKEGELLSQADDGTRFILKDWFVDRECNLRDTHEIISVISGVASIHKILRQIPIQEEWNMGSILSEAPQTEMERHNRELRRTKNYIRDKRRKSDFELCVIGNYQMFYEQAIEAQRGMAEQLENAPEINSFLCHGELNQHHVLMGMQHIAIVEFHKMHLGMQTRDLYHFMRKVMEKHNWNLYLGMSMLEAYDQVLPMGRQELEHLYYLFLYPEKYWKQLNFYYNANKAWIPSRNVEKLQILEVQQENRNRFIAKIK